MVTSNALALPDPREGHVTACALELSLRVFRITGDFLHLNECIVVNRFRGYASVSKRWEK